MVINAEGARVSVGVLTIAEDVSKSFLPHKKAPIRSGLSDVRFVDSIRQIADSLGVNPS
jgi:hypothetical protein